MKERKNGRVELPSRIELRHCHGDDEVDCRRRGYRPTSGEGFTIDDGNDISDSNVFW
ncbi:glycosyltransferase family 1 protein [Sesbania bispinosa]|nr:glycosyltransferase family 1 protein [Sesbania bispinosa]